MVSSTVTAGNTATKPGTTDTGNKNRAVRPFTKSSLLHDEPIAYDQSQQLGATTIRMPDIEIPASGYLRAVVLYITTSGGSGTSVTMAEDGPFNVLTDIILQEPNGSQIGYWENGFYLAMTDKYGGYFGRSNDPRANLNYGVTVGSSAEFHFVLRIPVETIMRDALTALPNQNMAAKYRIKFNLNTNGNVFGTDPSTAPTVRVRALLEGWEQPLEVVDGVPQATMPPLVNSTQFWTMQTFTVSAAGQQQIPLTRLGNRIRQINFIYHDAGDGTRATSDTDFPDPLTVSLDNRPILILPRYLWLERLSWYYGCVAANGADAVAADAAGGRDNGVWPLPFCEEFLSAAGQELGDLWLKTLTTSRLEISGNFVGTGTLRVMTNDIALTGDL